MIASGEIDEAARACDELAEIADAWGSGMLSAVTDQSRGAIDLFADRAGEALPRLRRAWQAWQTLDVPYEAARTRALLGLACRGLGDHDGARLELEAARSDLESLGAAHDVARLDALAGRSGGGAHGLTPREREVLVQLATGRTNRAIAAALFISEKTVARHVANIFGKLGISSRAAATAYAYEHDLQGPSA
jgi:DNA-binding CsgD family transcriptional regulator